MMEGTVGLKPPPKRLKRKVSRSQAEGTGKMKKPAEPSIKATTVSYERMQLYSILTRVTSSTIVVKTSSAPHSSKWQHILTVDHLSISSPFTSTEPTESLYW